MVSCLRSRDTKPREAFDQGCYCHLKKINVCNSMLLGCLKHGVSQSKSRKSEGPASNCEEQNPDPRTEILSARDKWQLCYVAPDSQRLHLWRAATFPHVQQSTENALHANTHPVRDFNWFLTKLGPFHNRCFQPTAFNAFFETIVLQDFQQTWPQTIVLRFGEFQQRLIFDSSG